MKPTRFDPQPTDVSRRSHFYEHSARATPVRLNGWCGTCGLHVYETVGGTRRTVNACCREHLEFLESVRTLRLADVTAAANDLAASPVRFTSI